MSTAAVIVIVVVAVVVIAAVAFAAWRAASRRRQRAELQERFGPEWERTVDRSGDPRAAEAELQGRMERRRELEIRPLPASSRDRYQQRWRDVQAQFVDQPAASLTHADALVGEAMQESGYPMEDFDRRSDLVSVDHPNVVEQYRRAHGIFMRNQTNPVSMDDMRTAFLSYRALFTELVAPADGSAGAGSNEKIEKEARDDHTTLR